MSDTLDGPSTEIIAVLVALTVGGLFSALSAALNAFGDVRLLTAVEQGGAAGRAAQRVLRSPESFHTRMIVGQVVSVVLAVALTIAAAEETLGGAALGWGGTVLVLAGLAFVYTAIAVSLQALMRSRVQTWTLPLLRWMRPLELAVMPLAVPLTALVRTLERWLPSPSPASDVTAVREVEHMIEEKEESGALSQDFAELLLSVLEFKDTVAREVMVPRTQTVAIEIGTSLSEILDLIVERGHSRYPVYRDRVDRIEGVLYAKDLFRVLREGGPGNVSLAELIRRPAFFVAETHPIGKLLREMQARRFHLAVVVDEFGGTSGIVTLEDIIEEIVGEIRDEHDDDDPPVTELSPGLWWVDARVSIYDLADVIPVDLEAEGAYDSVGGLVVELAGRVPAVGERVQVEGFDFIVRDADARHVRWVEVRQRQPLVQLAQA